VESPATTRELIEALLRRLNATTGPWTIELRAVDGRLERVYRHETIPATALGARFGDGSDDVR
jgi:hypothetical protein